MSYHGDIDLGDTIDVKFTSRRFSTGAPYTLAGSPAVAAYPDNSTTEVTGGITLTVDFDSRTGLNNIRVVATSGNGYATGTNYALVLTAGTVDSVSVVGEVVGSFSIDKRSALRPTTAGNTLDVNATGEAGIDWANVGGKTTTNALTNTTIATTQKVDVETIKTNPVVNAGTITFPTTATLASTTNITAGTITTATNVTTVNGLAANVITAASIADGAIDAATFAAGAIDAAAIATDAIGALELAAGAASEVATAVRTELATELARIDVAVSTRLAWASYTAPTNLTAAQIATGVWTDTTASDFTAALSIGKSIMNGVSLGTGLTINAYTGDTPQSGDSYAIVNSGVHGNAAIKGYVDDIGVAGAGLTALGDTRLANLDAAVTSRMASYTQPTGFLAATFPDTVASTTNITAGTITTTTNLTNLPAIPTDWITADGIAANAIGASELAADAATEIADAVLLRDVSNVEATANDHSLAFVILASSEFSVSGTTLTVKKTDGSTTFATKTLTKTTGDDPIRGMQ